MTLLLFKSVIFLLFHLSWVSGDEKSRTELEKEIFHNILMASKFQMYVRPTQNADQTKDGPLEVTVSLYILNTDIDVQNQECNIQMYFRQEWNDSRLSYSNQGKINVLSIHDSVGFWTPDLFFVNEKSGSLHLLTKPNIFIKIYPQGNVFYSQRVSVKLSCFMDLRKYPFDTQICTLPIESYGYSAEDIILKWKPERTFGINDPIHYQVSYSTVEDIIYMGENIYSRLELNIHFSRLIKILLLHVYLPLGLLVIASWLTFWLHSSSEILRLTVVVILVLTILTFFQSIKEYMIFQSYLTALDIWIGFSCLLIFGAICENIYVIASHNNRVSSHCAELESQKDTTDLSKGNKQGKIKDIFTTKFLMETSNMDKMSKILFPSVFGLFNIIYFLCYTM